MTTTIFLVRHAPHVLQGKVHVSRREGVALAPDPEGRLDWTVRELAKAQLAAVVASPLERTQATARAIAAPHGLTVEAEPDLNETDVGAWSGLTFDELEEDPLWKAHCLARRTTCPPGGESMLDVQHRAVSAIERLRRRHDEQAVVAVSHGDPIKAAICWYLGLNIQGMDDFVVDPAGVTALVIGDWGAKLLYLNRGYS